MPPGFNVIVARSTVKPFGPHHAFMCSRLVKHDHTRSRGALNTREMTKSGLAATALVAFMSDTPVPAAYAAWLAIC
jgi:hypothetical protein